MQKMEKIRQAIVKGIFVNFLVRVFNYVKYVVIALYMGFTAETDVFFLAMSVVGVIGVFANALETVGVPQLVKARINGDSAYITRVLSLQAGGMLLTLGLVSVFLMIMLPLLQSLPMGFASEKLYMYESYLVGLLPYAILMAVFQFMGAVLRSFRVFTLFFLLELCISVIVVGVMWYLFYIGHSRYALIFSHIIGGVAGVFLSAFFVNRVVGGWVYPDFSWKILEYVKKVFLVSFVSSAYYMIMVSDNYYGSYLPDKHISALSYGLLIASSPVMILRLHGYTITYISERDMKFLDILKIFLLILSLGWGMAAIGWIVMPWFVDIVFGYGSFEVVDRSLLVESARYYLICLPFFILWPVLYQVFQVSGELVVLGMLGIVSVVLNIFLNHVFVIYLEMGLRGIVFSTFLSLLLLSTFSMIYLRVVIERQPK